jgi:hypothetical protein
MRKKEMKGQQECEEKNLAAFTIPHILYCTAHSKLADCHIKFEESTRSSETSEIRVTSAT